jgi:NAD(P)-dependent dehydrogenase (short-subunit alcohol dehydrogenase family)
MSAYNSTKAAVISLSETLKIELAPHGIGVTVACPTFIPTNLMESFYSPDERQRRLAKKMFNGSRQTPERFAEIVHCAIRRKRLYAIVGSDGKLLWLTKRASPRLFYWFFSRGYSKARHVIDKTGSK